LGNQANQANRPQANGSVDNNRNVTPRNSERQVVTPPSVPRDNQSHTRSSRPENQTAPVNPGREYQSVPRTQTQTPQSNAGREYQSVPRSPRVYEDQPSRSAPAQNRNVPQYYPKGSQQSSEIPPTPRSYDSRQSGQSYSSASRNRDGSQNAGNGN